MRGAVWKFGLMVLGLSLTGMVASWSSGSGDFDADCDVDLVDFGHFEGCLSISGPSNPLPAGNQACADAFDADADQDLDLADFSSFQRAFTGRREPARIPPQHIALDNIGIHDPASANYNGDCIGCHGTRRDEVALDGVTPVAHAKMIPVIGEDSFPGNAMCLYCHQKGVDFLASSAAGLRKQIDIWAAECALCHLEAGSPGAPRFYVRRGP